MEKIKCLTCPSESTCHAVRHGVHNKCPHGSILMSLSFSAHILHNWKVLPAISGKKNRRPTIIHRHARHEIILLTHFAIKLVLLLCDGDVILQRTLNRKRQVGVVWTTIGIQVKALSENYFINSGTKFEGKVLTDIHRAEPDTATCFGELSARSRRRPLHSRWPTVLSAYTII